MLANPRSRKTFSFKWQQQAISMTWMLWGLYIPCVLAAVYLFNFKDTTALYLAAGQHWHDGISIYSQKHTFLYFPQTAIFFSFFQRTPTIVFDLLWRLLLMSLTALGLYRLARINIYGCQPFLFLMMSICSMILMLPLALQGSLLLLAMAVMMLAISEILDEHWWWAAAYLVFGFALAPQILLLLLLARVAYQRLLFRVLGLLILVLILPFFFQNGIYVLHQYSLMHDLIVKLYNTQLNSPQLLSLFPSSLSFFTQNIIRLVGLVLIFVLCFQMKPKLIMPNFCLMIYAFSITGILLLSADSRFIDYALLAPLIGYFLTVSMISRSIVTSILLIGFAIIISMGLFLSDFMASYLLWLFPLTTLAFMCYQGFYFWQLLE